MLLAPGTLCLKQSRISQLMTLALDLVWIMQDSLNLPSRLSPTMEVKPPQPFKKSVSQSQTVTNWTRGLPSTLLRISWLQSQAWSDRLQWSGLFVCSVPGSGPQAPGNKPTQCHHMMGSSVTDWEKSLLEAISFKWIYKERQRRGSNG